MIVVNSRTNVIVKIAVLASLSFVLLFIGFSLPFFPSFLKIDISELPVLIATISFGPISGILTSFVKNIFHLLFSKSMGIGELINFIMSCSFVLIFHYINNKYRKVKLALVISTLMTSFIAILVNYYIMFPLYKYILNIHPENILQIASITNPYIKNISFYFALVIFPFNMIKFGLVSLIMYFTYPVFKKAFSHTEA